MVWFRRKRGASAERVATAAVTPVEVVALTSTQSFSTADVHSTAECDLASLAALSAMASDANTIVGWVTHDIRAVAESGSTISEAVAALAESVSQLADAGVGSAAEAEQARRATDACVRNFALFAGSMKGIAAQVGEIRERLGVLEAAVRQIAEMAGAIEKISSQTSLLAFNATIEAARAGDAGLGFGAVANEVKALSAQTSGATDSIRARLAVLHCEMASIREVVDDSVATVTDGDAQLRDVERQIGAAGASISSIAERITELADLQRQQRSTVHSISLNVTQIADKASKTSGEFDAVIELLTAAERDAGEILDKAESRSFQDYLSLRFPADAAAFRRRLAAMLVGRARAEPHALGGGRRGASTAFAASTLVKDPAFRRLLERVDLGASVMAARLDARDRAGAISAFRDVEEALEEAASRVVLRRRGEAQSGGRDEFLPL